MLLDDILSQYDTFSHAWGIKNPTYIIQVDDGALAMIENLFKVLATLWAEDETLDLWADAICTDQDSTAEKNLQVRQMQEINLRGRTTRLWLGVPTRTFRDFFNTDAGYMHFVSEENVLSICFDIRPVIDHPHWTRLWIVQEVILFPVLQVYSSGAKMFSFSWETFVHLCKMVASGLDNRKVMARPSASTMLSLHRQRTTKAKRYFIDILRTYSACQCFEFRDRVFGLMSQAHQSSLEVDYTLSRTQLFEQTFWAHRAQFAENLAEVLFTALDVSSELELSFCEFPRLAIPVRIQERSLLVQSPERLAWSWNPKQILQHFSCDDEAIPEEDVRYTFSATPLAAGPDVPRLLVVLKSCLREKGSDLQSPKKIGNNRLYCSLHSVRIASSGRLDRLLSIEHQTAISRRTSLQGISHNWPWAPGC